MRRGLMALIGVAVITVSLDAQQPDAKVPARSTPPTLVNVMALVVRSGF